MNWGSIKEEETEFEKSSRFWWFPDVSITDLPDGSNSLTVSLDNVKWITLNFDVVP